MSHILIPAISALSNALFSQHNSHPGLRQQVIAVRIKNLSKEINELVASYDKSLAKVTETRKAIAKHRRKPSKTNIERLNAKLHTQERQLLSSHIPLKIVHLNALLKRLNHEILDQE